MLKRVSLGFDFSVPKAQILPHHENVLVYSTFDSLKPRLWCDIGKRAVCLV